jgi:hypothetical protein
MNPRCITSPPSRGLCQVDDAAGEEVVGFLLYSPVPTHPEACGKARDRGLNSSISKQPAYAGCFGG